MINILGERNGEVAISGLERVLGIQDTYVHLYGKSPTKVDRKMGHITVLANDLDEARLIAEKARGEISV
jgi:5-(carboxyamino)imidazole ribonucleotide synthase